MADLRRYLQIRTATGGDTLADGSRLAFLTDITGLPQVWSVPAGGGWPDQATFAAQRVERLVTSPVDPAVVTFARDTGGNERSQIHRVRPDGQQERVLAHHRGVIHRLGPFLPDGRAVLYCANVRSPVDFDLFAQPVDGGPARCVARLDGSNEATHVASDGSAAIVAHQRSSMDGDLLLVRLADGQASVLTAHREPARHLPGGVSADGRDVFVRSDRGSDTLAAYRLGLDRGDWRPLWPSTPIAGRDVEALAVRGGTGALVVNDDGRSRLWRVEPGTGEITDAYRVPFGVIEDLRVSPDGRRLTFTFTGPDAPADVWQADPDRLVAGPVTASSRAGIDPGSFVVPERHAAVSFDGLAVPLWCYRPRGARGPVPVVVSVHGGPEAQERPRFQAFYQYLLARGVAVVAPNVRGSTGYGRRYASLDDRRRRMDAVADLDAVARWIDADPGLDGGRRAVMGASYGGFMTLSALATYPDRWAAGVSIVGIANLVTFLERTGEYRRALREAEYGSLAEDADFLAEISPLHHAESITAPLFVVHGANDPRVPVGEARQIADRLEALGRPVELLVFDDEGHGLVRLPNRVTAYERIAAFLERHLEVCAP